MAAPRRKSEAAARTAKVIQVCATDASKIGEQLEAKLNEFLAENPSAEILHTHLHMLDIGGTSQADIIVLYTVIYRD